MGLIAIESMSTGIRWTTDGTNVATAPTLDVLLAELREPHAFVCEPEFFDGLRDVRHHLETWLGEHGHRLFPMTSGARDVLEAAGGVLVSGRGVRRLHALAIVGSARIDRESIRGEDFWDIRDALGIAHAVDVYAGAGRALAQAIGVIGPYSSWDQTGRRALGDGRAYRADVVLAAYRVATISPNRDTFEGLLGLSRSGHGPLTWTIRSWRANDVTPGAEADVPWAEYRLALRRIFHLVISQRRSTRQAACQQDWGAPHQAGTPEPC